MRAHEFIIERKKRKNRSRRAAYGPGLYGGYGFYAGYSGDSGSGDGGVGEDQHPNERPRGPETKPSMPKGTVKVDVSDVYDWYKLGQHISDLEGLGKHDFGKGPPSAILSFGSEDEEHKYIKNLKRTGLDTTDIDPKSHEKKKGQKTDPTYNVGENFNKEADEYELYLKKTLPQIMRFLNGVRGAPSEQQMVKAIDIAVDVMRRTGDVKQAARAKKDYLDNISQGQQGMTEYFVEQRKFTDLELAIMEGGGQVESDKVYYLKKQLEEQLSDRYKHSTSYNNSAGITFRIPVYELLVNRNTVVHKWQLRGDKNFGLIDEVPSVVLKNVSVAIDQNAYDNDRKIFAYLQGDRTNNIPQGLEAFPIGYRRNSEYPFIDKSTGEPIMHVDYVEFSDQGKVTGYKQLQNVAENFADGKNPGRKGLAKRSGVNCKASVSTLRNVAKNSSGEKQRMAHWCANMKSGRNK